MLWTALLLLSQFADSATLLYSGQSCNGYAITWDGTNYTCTDNSVGIPGMQTNTGPDMDVYVSTYEFVTGSDRIATAIDLYSDTLVLGNFLGRSLGSRASPSAVTAGIGIGQKVMDTTVDQRFNCRASRATGGHINFVHMRVSKACQ